MKIYRCNKYILDLKRVNIMGILNITPDSFYDGGKYNSVELAIEHAMKLVNEGADVIEVGGQSFRPGAAMIDEQEEIRRIIPVIEKLSEMIDVPICIDTYRHSVAQRALEAGASIIDDVWGLKKEQNIADIVFKYNAGIILAHNSISHHYKKNIMDAIVDSLNESVKIALSAGLNEESIMVDPGIATSFGKTFEQQYYILKKLDCLKKLNLPILIATSRKSFLGSVIGEKPEELLVPTIVSEMWGVIHGANMLRVHDVKETKKALSIIEKIMEVEENGE